MNNGKLETIRETLLLERGFSRHDIETNFADYTGEWNISTMTLEQLMSTNSPRELGKLFRKDSVEVTRFCATYIGGSFDSFAVPAAPFQVSPSVLDPYIARLCRAVNEIGVKTCMSCDGWHKRKTTYSAMDLYMRDRYSVQWFWFITEHIFGEHWKHSAPNSSSWNNIWEPFDSDPYYTVYAPRDMMSCKYRIRDREEAYRVFAKNNSYAEFIEDNRDDFLWLRDMLIDSLRDRMEFGEIEDIESVGFMQLRRYFEEILLPEIEPLAEKFAQWSSERGI